MPLFTFMKCGDKCCQNFWTRALTCLSPSPPPFSARARGIAHTEKYGWPARLAFPERASLAIFCVLRCARAGEGLGTRLLARYSIYDYSIDLIPYGTGLETAIFHTPMRVMPDVIHMVRVVKNARSYTDYGASTE